jgi:hypothetical protein
MSASVKFGIGLVIVLLFGWIWHGPVGTGERHINGIESEVKRVVAESEVPGVTVELKRNPLQRVATLAGPADEFQRRGQGSLKGLTQRVDDVEGVAAVQWEDEAPSQAFVLPLLAESLLPIIGGYLLGIALGWRIWGRRRSDRYY